MPIATEMTVKAREVQKGDVLATNDFEVARVKNGHKLTSAFSVTDTIIMRLEFDNPVKITRMMPTEEEIAAKQAERDAMFAAALEEDISQWVGATLENYSQQSNAALATIAETPGREFSGRSGVIHLLNLGAYYYIAQRIQYIHDYKGEDGTEDRTWAQAYQAWREQTAESTMSRYQSYPFQKDVVQQAFDEATNNAERMVYHALDYGNFYVR